MEADEDKMEEELKRLEARLAALEEEEKRQSSKEQEEKRVRECSRSICVELKERNERMVREVVRRLGVKNAENLLRETLLVEERGGLSVKDGTRRKSAGGVFLVLAKEQLGSSIFANIATQDTKRRKKNSVKNKRKGQKGTVAVRTTRGTHDTTKSM